MTLWKDDLYRTFRSRALPLVWTPDALVPAASLWSGARERVAALRALGVRPGDRVLCALPPGPAFVTLLVAALWEELTFVPVAPNADVPALAADVDAAVIVTHGPLERRTAFAPPTPDARFLLRTSGTTGAPRWIALGDANVRAVLASHAPALALDPSLRSGWPQATVLSVLPWHHAFGLVLELLPALFAGAEIVRDPAGGRDIDALLAIAREHPVTHLSAVPLTMRRLVERAPAFVRALRGGVIGGAPVDDALAAELSATRLRAGYGQTEASPGIALGAPGAWRAGTLGAPLGCDVRLDDDRVLAFRGPNACLGDWRDGALHRLAPDRWVRTGDLARRERDGTYTFEGRLADTIKLANARFVAAASVERAVRRHFPAVEDALLSSPDGETLLLAVGVHDAATAPAVDAVRPLLGPLATRPLRVVAVAPDAWVRTAKGEIDRRHPVGRPG